MKKLICAALCICCLLTSACSAAPAISGSGSGDTGSGESKAASDVFQSGDWNNIVDVIAGADYTIGLRSDGTVAFAGNDYSGAGQAIAAWEGIERIDTNWSYIIGYKEDGSVVVEPLCDDYAEHTFLTNEDFASWTDVEDLRIWESGCVGLHKDGSVSLICNDDYEYSKLSKVLSWSGIEQLASTYSTIYGLKSDGTVVVAAADDNSVAGWESSSEWKNVEKLVCCTSDWYWCSYGYVFAIKQDGIVLGLIDGWLNPFETVVGSSWTNIDSFCAGDYVLYGLRHDGTVVAASEDSEDDRLSGLDSWTNIVQLEQSFHVPVGLCSDGTVRVPTHYSDSDSCYSAVSDWSKVVKLYCGQYYIAGLRSDGTVLATGADWCDDISSWTDIEEIFAYPYGETGNSHHVVGLKKDGTLVAAGDNDCGQCDVTGTASSGAGTNTGTSTGKPSSADLDALGDKIVYPQEESYLNSYETMYVKTTKGHSAYVFWEADGNMEHRRNRYVYEKDEVTVLARENGYSCVICTHDNGTFAGWVYSEFLVYEY